MWSLMYEREVLLLEVENCEAWISIARARRQWDIANVWIRELELVEAELRQLENDIEEGRLFRNRAIAGSELDDLLRDLVLDADDEDPSKDETVECGGGGEVANPTDRTHDA